MSEYPPPIILKTNNAPVIINYEDFVPTPIKKYSNIVITDNEKSGYCDLSLICHCDAANNISKSILLEKFFSTIKVNDQIYNINNNFTNITFYNNDDSLDNITFSSVTNNKKYEISNDISVVKGLVFNNNSIEYYDDDISEENRIYENFDIPSLIKTISTSDNTFKMRFFNNMIFYKKLPTNLEELNETDLKFYKRTVSSYPVTEISSKFKNDFTPDKAKDINDSIHELTPDPLIFNINDNNTLTITIQNGSDDNYGNIELNLQYKSTDKDAENNNYSINISQSIKDIEISIIENEDLEKNKYPVLNINVKKENIDDGNYESYKPENSSKNTLNDDLYAFIEYYEHFQVYYYYNNPYKIYTTQENKKYIKKLEYIIIEFEDNTKIKILNDNLDNLNYYYINTIYLYFTEIDNNEYKNIVKITKDSTNYLLKSKRTYYTEEFNNINIDDEKLLQYIYENFYITYSLAYKIPNIDCKNTILKTNYDKYNVDDFEQKKDNENNIKYELNKKDPRELQYEVYVTLCFKDEHSKIHKSIFNNSNELLNDDGSVFDNSNTIETDEKPEEEKPEEEKTEEEKKAEIIKKYTKKYNDYVIKFTIDIPYFIYDIEVNKISNTTTTSTSSSSKKNKKESDNRLLVKYTVDVKTSNFVYCTIAQKEGFYNEILRRYVTYESRLVDINSSTSSEGNTEITYENNIKAIISLIIKNQNNSNTLSKEFIARWLMTNTHYCPQSNCTK